mmetsp:Transcript_53685/g.153136  ORF Transcript_53685/g.153136 Transcript_53685/m.153136 type:complete len:298 (-) Transcript_53685:6-899(-)
MTQPSTTCSPPRARARRAPSGVAMCTKPRLLGRRRGHSVCSPLSWRVECARSTCETGPQPEKCRFSLLGAWKPSLLMRRTTKRQSGSSAASSCRLDESVCAGPWAPCWGTSGGTADRRACGPRGRGCCHGGRARSCSSCFACARGPSWWPCCCRGLGGAPPSEPAGGPRRKAPGRCAALAAAPLPPVTEKARSWWSWRSRACCSSKSCAFICSTAWRWGIEVKMPPAACVLAMMPSSGFARWMFSCALSRIARAAFIPPASRKGAADSTASTHSPDEPHACCCIRCSCSSTCCSCSA